MRPRKHQKVVLIFCAVFLCGILTFLALIRLAALRENPPLSRAEHVTIRNLEAIAYALQEETDIAGACPESLAGVTNPLPEGVIGNRVVDGWGHDLLWRGTDGTYRLISAGRDGKWDTWDDMGVTVRARDWTTQRREP